MKQKVFTLDQFKKWGAKGAKVRKHRVLTREQALAMVEARKAKKLTDASALSADTHKQS